MKETRKQRYFFGVLESSNRKLLKLGAPIECRVIKSERSGGEDMYHIGSEKSENFIMIKKPVFTKLVETFKFDALNSRWREYLKDSLCS